MKLKNLKFEPNRTKVQNILWELKKTNPHFILGGIKNFVDKYNSIYSVVMISL